MSHKPVQYGLSAQQVVSLVRPAIAGMKAYTPILPFEVLSEQLGCPAETIIKLDANENPYGAPPKALAALRYIDAQTPIYPDPEARALRARLAEYHGIDMQHLLIGAGADELIDLITRLILNPGDAVIDCPPTFSMYAFDTMLNGGRVIRVPRRADFSLDLEAIEQAAERGNARLLFIAAPNNPDGGLPSPMDLERLLRLPLLLVIDEAYIHFSSMESAIHRVRVTPNLIVLRTFSKWAGLAGLRVGYGAFPLNLITHMWKIKQPYNLSVAADAAARAALEELDTLEANTTRIVTERERLIRELAAVPFLRPYHSQGNFVLCRVVGRSAAELKDRLAKEYGILIRYFDQPGLDDHVRITAGRPEHTDALLQALRELGGSR